MCYHENTVLENMILYLIDCGKLYLILTIRKEDYNVYFAKI